MAHSYRTRVIVLLLLLVATIQFPVFLSVYFATRGNALEQADERLDVGARVFNRLLETRGQQLRSAVGLVAADFGFREAVASRDEATVQSVLVNHGGRIAADFAVMLDLKGRVTTSTLDIEDDAGATPFAALFARAGADETVSGIAATGNEPFQIVLVPVKAPQRIGWVGMGFRMDAALASEFRKLSGLEVSFVVADAKDGLHIYSTLPAELQQALARALGDQVDVAPASIELGDDEYLSRRLPLGEAGSVEAVLQASMESAMRPYASLRRQLLLISTLAFALSVLGAWLLARGVTRPVQQLADAANRIGRGDYLAEVATARDDELGRLAEAFRSMQRGIADREQKITHLAYHDALTNLPNRANIERQLLEALATADSSERLAVLMIDVNRFKEINDTLGHPIGDRLLVNIGQRMRSAVRASDTVARLGGDEFLLVLGGADARVARRVAEKLVAAVTEPMQLDTLELFPDISIGIALFPEHARTADDLIRRADIAMYDAKNARIPITVYESGRDAQHLRRLSLINDLRRAAENGELVVHYQPTLDLDHGRITHVEALARWLHPREGFIQPDEFIPLAEHSGSIRLITDWMLRTVIRQCREWGDQGHAISVAINISAIDLASGNLPATISRYLEQHAVSPQRLVLEITESAVMRDAALALDMLRKLKACGLRLAIDDFGTGYSSLSHLKRMPVDEIKIDKSFVMGMADDNDDAVIVRSTIELGHNMGLSVVAEGVDNPRALRMLEDYHCDMAQGFLISRPVAVEDLTDLLAAQRDAVKTTLEST